MGEKKSGGDLLSHKVTPAVSSARQGLTSVFGMGTGVTLAAKPPENLIPDKKISEVIHALMHLEIQTEGLCLTCSEG